MKRKTTQEFINECKNIHNDKYDYSLVEYKNNKTKVKIICPVHGVFEQIPKSHLKGSGCYMCGLNKFKKTDDKFIEESKKIHGDKYDYSLVDYKNSYTKVKIICPVHDVFEQTPQVHLRGHGCNICTKMFKKTTIYFIEESKKIHGDKYDYSLVDYKNSYTKVKIICPIHGIFTKRPNAHILKKEICPRCSTNRIYNTLDFIKKCSIIHNNHYDYSLVDYINSTKHIKIICPVHGIFKQKPYIHVIGKGCPLCKLSKGENKIKRYLDLKNIKYETEKTFKKCKNKNLLRFDFYLIKYNILIEYDGEIHFKSIEKFGGDNKLLYTKNNDKIKNEYCKKNNIKLYRIKYTDNIEEKINEIISSL